MSFFETSKTHNLCDKEKVPHQNGLIELKSTWTLNGFTPTSGSRWEVSHQEKEADRKRSEHAARTTYILCRSSRRVLTLFCQSLKSLFTSRSASPHNQPHTFENQVRSCKTKKLKRKNQTNPPNMRGRTRTRGCWEKWTSLSLSWIHVCSWCLVSGAEERDGIGGRTYLASSAATSQG